jgi:hypothetical protein
VGAALREEVDLHERATSHERELERLASVLDEKGLALQPAELSPPYGSLRTLDRRHREMLGELVSCWWPESGLVAAEEDEGLAEPTRIMLLIGVQTTPALTPSRWLELLDAHLASHEWRERELADQGVTTWLAATYHDEYEQHLASRIATAQDATALSKLIAISRRDRRTPRLTDLAFARLAELSSATPMWMNAVALLVEDGHIDQARALLAPGIPTATREGIIARLAAHGDSQAQMQIIDGLTLALESGRSPERPHWHSTADSSAVVAAASQLADAALTHDAKELPGFALSLIQARPDEESLTLLVDLAAKHQTENPWLSIAVEQMARRIATRQVLLRLPTALDQVASEFEIYAEKTPSR